MTIVTRTASPAAMQNAEALVEEWAQREIHFEEIRQRKIYARLEAMWRREMEDRHAEPRY